jgi:hypothetical protein
MSSISLGVAREYATNEMQSEASETPTASQSFGDTFETISAQSTIRCSHVIWVSSKRTGALTSSAMKIRRHRI